MQWFIAFISACIFFALIYTMQQDNSPDKNTEDKKDTNKLIILFFFIVIIFQILFYYFDIGSSLFSGKTEGAVRSAGSALTDDSASQQHIEEILKLSKGQQELLEKELLRSIHQDINVGYPGF